MTGPAPQALRVGELRPSQLLHTYGIGAVTDLPNLSTMVLGLDDWDPVRARVLTEDRLLAAVRRRLGNQVTALRTPPHLPENPADPYGDWTRTGVPVGLFPRWLRCSRERCNQLAPASSGLFQLRPNLYRPEKPSTSTPTAEAAARASPPRCPPASWSPAPTATWTTSRGCTSCTEGPPPAKAAP